MVTTVLSASVLIVSMTVCCIAYNIYRHEKALQCVTDILERMESWVENLDGRQLMLSEKIADMGTRVSYLEGKVMDMEKEIKKMKDTAVILEADHERN